MDILARLREDEDLAQRVYDQAEFEVYTEPQPPQDARGTMQFNAPAAAIGQDGSGGQFLLLEDGSIAINGSEGECGRIADSVEDLFALLLGAPSFWDFLVPELWQDEAFLRGFVAAMDKSAREENEGYDTERQALAQALGVPLTTGAVALLQQFHTAAMREPRFSYTFTEKDGKTWCSGTLFERPCRPWMREAAGL